MALTPSPSPLEGSEEPQAVWTTKGANVWTTKGANVWTTKGANVWTTKGANVWTTNGANVWTTNGAKWQEGRERETAPLWPGSRWFAPVRGFVVQRAWVLRESGVRAAVPERKV